MARNRLPLMCTALIAMLAFGPATADTDEQRVARIIEPLSLAIFDGDKDVLVARLKRRGLDEQTAEATVRELRLSVAHCVVEAIRTFSLTKAQRFEDHLTMLEAALSANDVESYLDALPKTELKGIVGDCVRSEFHNAGLELEG